MSKYILGKSGPVRHIFCDDDVPIEIDARDVEIEELKKRVAEIEKNIALIGGCLETILEIFKGFRDGNGENLDDFPDRPGGEE